MNILDDVKRILAQPFECRKTSLPDGALHNVQKELENMINAIDKDIYSFTPSYGKYLIDCWLGDELVDKLLDVSCQYEEQQRQIVTSANFVPIQRILKLFSVP